MAAGTSSSPSTLVSTNRWVQHGAAATRRRRIGGRLDTMTTVSPGHLPPLGRIEPAFTLPPSAFHEVDVENAKMQRASVPDRSVVRRTPPPDIPNTDNAARQPAHDVSVARRRSALPRPRRAVPPHSAPCIHANGNGSRGAHTNGSTPSNATRIPPPPPGKVGGTEGRS